MSMGVLRRGSPLVGEVISALEPWIKPRRITKMRDVLSRRTDRIRIVLENIEDPHNAAACLRSADAFGIHHVDVVDKYAPFRVNQSIVTGADRWLTIQHHSSMHECMNELHESGHIVLASHLDPDAHTLEDLVALALPASVRTSSLKQDLEEEASSGSCAAVAAEDVAPLALVFGNETRGASKYALKRADYRFYLPMAGMAQSLNISVACACTLAQLALLAPNLPPLPQSDQQLQLAKWLVRDVNASKSVLAQAGIACDDL